MPSTVEGVRFVEVVTGGAAADDRLPMVVAIHGLGDSPERFAPVFAALSARARVVAPAGLRPYGGGYSWFDVGSRGDPRAFAAGLARAADVLERAIAGFARARPTCGAPIITGFSQGGMLAFALAARAPERIAAAFPMAGLLPPSLVPRWSAPPGRLPAVHAFHGTDDARVPVAAGRAAVGALRDAGYAADLREYQGLGHAVNASLVRDLDAQLSATVRAMACSSGP